MSEIKPNDANLLTETDVDYSRFSCCGDEDLVFLRCKHCGHIWVECYECSTWYVDLHNLDSRQQCFLTSEDQRLACPTCDQQFEDSLYLADDNCHNYLPTREQVVSAGLTHFLSDEQKAKVAPGEASSVASSNTSKTIPTRPIVPSRKWPVILASFGAAAWLGVFAIKLLSLGLTFDAMIPLVAGLCIVLTGVWIWTLRCRGDEISLWTAIQYLLAATALFGLVALVVLNNRGVLDAIIDPNGKFPAYVNFLLPLVLVAMMALFCLPPLKKPLDSRML